MENSGFLKSVSFGGFDKKDVLAYVDDLNTKIYTLEAELEEARSRADGMGKTVSNFDGAEKYEEMLAKERAHVSELMAKNDTLMLTVQSHESVIADKDSEIEALNEKISDLENKVNSHDSNEEASSFDIGSVFIEAKKSADKIMIEAKNAVKRMDADAKNLASQVVDEANQKAQGIVSEADIKAEKIIMNAEAKTSELKEVSDKLKSTLLKDIENIYSYIKNLNETIADFSRGSNISLEKAKGIISDAENAIKNVDNPLDKADKKFNEVGVQRSDIRSEKTAMSINEMAELAKSLTDQIEAETVQIEEL